MKVCVEVKVIFKRNKLRGRSYIAPRNEYSVLFRLLPAKCRIVGDTLIQRQFVIDLTSNMGTHLKGDDIVISLPYRAIRQSSIPFSRLSRKTAAPP